MRVRFAERDGDIFYLVTHEEARRLASIDPDHSLTDPSLFCQEKSGQFGLTVRNMRLDGPNSPAERFYVVEPWEPIGHPHHRASWDTFISAEMCQELINLRPCGDRYKSRLYDSPKVSVHIDDELASEKI